MLLMSRNKEKISKQMYLTLQNELANMADKNNVLEAKLDNIYKAINCSSSELSKMKNMFTSPYLHTDGTWHVTTAYCNLGGCELKYFDGATKKEALLRSVIATILGQTSDFSCCCNDCYKESLKESI